MLLNTGALHGQTARDETTYVQILQWFMDALARLAVIGWHLRGISSGRAWESGLDRVRRRGSQ
jgi:hypothetical protein